jgi:iron complex outermembrane receptor protein
VKLARGAMQLLRTICGGLSGAAAVFACAHAHSQSLADLRGLSLEELSQVSVTVVQRRSQPLQEAPGAIYVLTAEDIRRSGATTLPEALRLAPNLQVGRESANEWAISARGFNSTETANKLLVLIDSRSVYSPLHAGVFWDEEHVLLEDVERIEIVSGPGGALWGANAVNGVINVITRNSEDTQGMAGRATYGTLDSRAAARVGGPLGGNGAFRVYGSAFRTENTFTSTGANALDDYDGVSGGARADWRYGEGSTATLHAEAFDDNILAGELWGGYVRARVNHAFENQHRLFIQAYYDTTTRKGFISHDRTETLDVTVQHSWAPMGEHQIITGGGYRHTADRYFLPGLFTLDPPEANQDLINAFVQDSYAITSDLSLTAGLKVEDSSFSGFEYMPSARLAWTLSDDVLLWAAASRAVRTPVRLDRDLVAPDIFIGGPIYRAEELVAYEAGYRGRPTARTSLSISFFVHDYDDLRTTTPLPGAVILPAQFTNDLAGVTYGVEAWGDFQAADWWLLRAGLTTLEKDFDLRPGVLDIANPPSTGNDPSFQAMLRSRMNFGPDVEFDVGLRYVDDLPDPYVPDYVELDARMAWQATDALELSIVGINLLHEDHPETSAENPPNRIRRGVFVGANWGF